MINNNQIPTFLLDNYLCKNKLFGTKLKALFEFYKVAQNSS